MADATNKQIVGAPFSNAEEIRRVIYDFSVDGGTIGDFSLMEASSDLVILECYMNVKTTLTSGGSATLDLGIDGGAEFKSAEAVASFSAGSVIQCISTAAPIKLASGAKVDFGVAVADLTAGKLEVYMRVAAL